MSCGSRPADSSAVAGCAPVAPTVAASHAVADRTGRHRSSGCTCWAAGRGRTGTVLACLAVLDGVAADDAVDHVRRGYHPRAVETPWQRRYVRRFATPGPPAGEH